MVCIVTALKGGAALWASPQGNVVIIGEFEGFHFWKDAPAEVRFLKNLHRHKFHVEVTIDVKHNNRALEFFIVQHFLEDFIKVRFSDGEVGPMSCEMIAEVILDAVQIQYNLKKQ